MKIEIVEFYPEKKPVTNNYLGTLHIYLIDFDIDVRGIGVLKHGKGYRFRLPCKTGFDEDSGEKVKYPVFVFPNPTKLKDFFSSLLALARPYITNKFKEIESKKVVAENASQV